MKSTLVVAMAAAVALVAGCNRPPRPPNIVVFLTDDQGYSDLSSYGHPTIVTPRIDRMATEGVRFTSFYAAPACTPSRAQLLTGRYAVRTGLVVPQGPNSPVGIQPDEVTLAEALHDVGYRTAMVGKWHLGDFATRPEFSPLAHGFDVFFGIPYSHDYRPPFVMGAPPVPLYRGLEEVERPVVFETLTERFTDEAVEFIRDSSDQPFFLYLAYSMPHLPVETPPEFAGRSRAGRYGDVIEEIDASVGRVLDVLAELGLDERTVSVFFSDNGPWSNAPPRSLQETQSAWDTGTAGLLRGAKGTTWEGGMRVPGIVRQPGVIPAGRTSADMVSELDLFPTLLGMAGADVPSDRVIDGVDLGAYLLEDAEAPRQTLFYFAGRNLQGVREGPWKLRVRSETDDEGQDVTVAELFDLDRDPGERRDVALEYPDVVARLQASMVTFEARVERRD